MYSEALINFSDKELGITIYGSRENELLLNIVQEILFLWKHYALEKDENLSPKAQILKANLLKRIHQI